MNPTGNGFERDPYELRIPKDLSEEFQLTFVVLPGLAIGEKYTKIVNGKPVIDEVGPDQNMDGDFYFPNGKHWFGRGQKPLECPRVQLGSHCPLCQLGFDLMTGQSKEIKSRIAKKYLASERWAFNIYVLNDQLNPEEYRDKVLWFNAPKTIQDRFRDCINRLDEGEDPYEKLPYGVFFHPDSCYIFRLKVKPKGNFPDYGDSKFLAGSGKLTLEQIINNEKTKSKYTVQEILDMRFSIKEKFDPIDIDALNEKVNQIKSGGLDESEEAFENVIIDQQDNIKPTKKVDKKEVQTNVEKPHTEKHDNVDIDEAEVESEIDKLLDGL